MQKNFLYHNSIISYQLEGKGDPVILLHGFGEDRHIWDQQILFLKEHCLLIIPDIPGSGKSTLLEKNTKENVTVSYPSQTHNHSNISMEDYCDCIYAILQEEQIKACIMLGHSMGGYITLAFAKKYPAYLKGFGLIHSTAYADSQEKKKIREKAIESIAKYGAHAFLKSTIPNLFGATFKKEQYAAVDKLINASISFTKESLQQYYRAMMNRIDMCSVFQSNPIPVLFVIGTEDTAVPMEDILDQTSLPLHSQVHILPGIGHMSMLEASGELNTFILAFIQSK